MFLRNVSWQRTIRRYIQEDSTLYVTELSTNYIANHVLFVRRPLLDLSEGQSVEW
jgi:hypothetical protein